MSHSGEVKVWKSKKRGDGYGFAHCTDESVVWISGAELGEGMRLVAGKTVNFDLAEAEGHGNRKQGLNVTGEGVVDAESFTQTKEEEAAAKKLWNDYVENTIKPLAGDTEKKPARSEKKNEKNNNNNNNNNDNSNPRSKGNDYHARGTRGGMGGGGKGGSNSRYGSKGGPPSYPSYSGRNNYDSYGGGYGGYGGGSGYGYGSGGGMMMTSNDYRSQLAVIPARAERRTDPNDGKLYSKEEFRKCYNSYREWDSAEPKEAPKQPAGRGAGSSEKRLDPSDGCPYTKESFIAEYGGSREWDRAKLFKPGMGRGRIS